MDQQYRCRRQRSIPTKSAISMHVNGSSGSGKCTASTSAETCVDARRTKCQATADRYVPIEVDERNVNANELTDGGDGDGAEVQRRDQLAGPKLPVFHALHTFAESCTRTRHDKPSTPTSSPLLQSLPAPAADSPPDSGNADPFQIRSAPGVCIKSSTALLETQRRHLPPSSFKSLYPNSSAEVCPLQPAPVAMPPSNTPNPTVQSNGHARKRTAPVVPAIPLALSKPRTTKAQPKSASDAKGGAEELTPVGIPAEVVGPTEGSTAGRDGIANGNMQANGLGTSENENTIAAEAAAQDTGTSSIANGIVSNGTGSQASRPSTASTPGDVTVTNSPELARKPTERFDMRQIRTELPPAFVPSAEQHTPRSNASSQSARQPIMPAHIHSAHASGSNIVFGSRDSSSSSPAPPQSAGSAYNAPPFSSFNGASATPFHPSGHAHHPSESQASRTFHPGFQQPVPPWNARQGYAQQPHPGPSHHPHAHTPFRYPPREAFTPVDSPHGNGKLSRPASQASSAAADQPRSAHLQSPYGTDFTQDSRNSFPPQHTRQFDQQMPPPPPHHLQAPDVGSQMDNAEALRAHIISRFGNPNFADCSIHLSEEFSGARQTFSGHRVILSRSPTLMHLLSNQTASSSGAIEVQAPLKGRYLKLATVNDALKYLYGGPLLLLDPPRPGSSAGERTLLNTEKMETAVSYIAAGSWLKVPALAGRGVEIAGSLLHWDTMPTALAFALDGGLSQMWTVDDGSEDPFSAASSDDSLGRSEITGAPSYDPYSTALLQRIVDFMIHVFPPNFFIDAAAPQLESCQRLPTIAKATGHDGRSSVSDPRLSQIRFGEIPTGPSFTTTMISSILLSLPFQLLKAVLEHFIFATRLGPETAASIMRQVVTERERRRTKAQEARSAGQISSSTDAQLLQNLYWEEFVEPSMQHKVGFRLARRRKGIDTPLSSGPE